jgi:heptosyltransferase-3
MTPGDNRSPILVYRLGSLGDTVVALPCFHLIARMFPGRTRILLTNKPVHAKAPAASSVFGESGLVHQYITYSLQTRNPIALGRLCWKIRRLGIKTMIYLTPPRGELTTRRDEAFFRICGVKEIIGLPHGDLARHAYDSVTGRYESEATRLARCIARVGDARITDPASWDLLLSQQEKERADQVLRLLAGAKFLALGIASKQNVTDWGIGNWAKLMPLLQRKFPEYALAFVGAKEDHSAIEEVSRNWAGKYVNTSGLLSPRESAAVIRRSDLFIGVDSGPMHLAASVGALCVSISAANKRPGIWFPFGTSHEVIYHETSCCGCNLEICTVEKNRCIASISPDEVVAAVVRAAERKTRKPDLRKCAFTGIP